MSTAPDPTLDTSVPSGSALSATAGLPYPSSKQAWWTLTVLLLLNVASCLDRQILALMVDDVKADLLISDFQVSLLQGITFALFYTIFGLPFGWAVDRYPRRGIIFTGVTIWSFAASACGLAQSFWQLLLARIGVGVGEAALSPAAFSLLSDTFTKARLALALSIYSTGAVIGSALALAIGGLLVGLLPDEGVVAPLLGQLANWQVVYIVTGLPCLLVGWLIFTIADPVRRGKTMTASTGAGDAFRFMTERWRFFLPHFAGFGLMSMCGYGIMLWSPAYLHRVFGWDMLVIGPMLALVMLTGVLGGTALGAIVDRLFSRGMRDAHLRVYAVVAVLQAIIVVAAVAAHDPYIYLALIAVFHLISSFTGVASAALQTVTPNEYRGQVSAAFLLSFNILGLGCGPSVVAGLTSFVYADPAAVGWSIATAYIIIMPLSALCFVAAFRPMRRAVDEAAID